MRHSHIPTTLNNCSINNRIHSLVLTQFKIKWFLHLHRFTFSSFSLQVWWTFSTILNWPHSFTLKQTYLHWLNLQLAKYVGFCCHNSQPTNHSNTMYLSTVYQYAQYVSNIIWNKMLKWLDIFCGCFWTLYNFTSLLESIVADMNSSCCSLWRTKLPN